MIPEERKQFSDLCLHWHTSYSNWSKNKYPGLDEIDYRYPDDIISVTRHMKAIIKKVGSVDNAWNYIKLYFEEIDGFYGSPPPTLEHLMYKGIGALTPKYLAKKAQYLKLKKQEEQCSIQEKTSLKVC